MQKWQRLYTSLHGEKTGDLALSFSPDKDKKSLTEKPIPKTITRGDVVFRSTFLPGWGQSYAGAKTKGTIYSASALATLGFFAYNLQAMNKAQSEYNSKLALVGTPLFYPTYFLPDGGDIVRPDITVVLNENGKIIEKWIFGTPDLVCEVLSDSTRTYDLGRKADRYLSNGVREFWIVDTDAKTISGKTAGRNGRRKQMQNCTVKF